MYNGGGSFFLSDILVDYLEKYGVNFNRLDSAIYSDIRERPEYLIGCRVLGLVDKLVIANICLCFV